MPTRLLVARSLGALAMALTDDSATAAGIIQNTGKGSTYRYYCYSWKLKEEVFSCNA